MTFTALFTGSRDYQASWRVREAVTQVWREHDYDVFIRVGDCPTGVDNLVSSMCKTAGIPYKEYEARWTVYGKKAGPIRNGDMVRDGADLCVAFPLDESRGTKDCTKQAYDAGIPVWFPDLPDWAFWAVPIASWD